MSISTIIKDFLWWLIKENRVVNWSYQNLAPGIFLPQPVPPSLADKPLTSKSDYLDAKPASWPAIKGFSSGTTNQPLKVYRSIKSILLEEYVIKSTFSRYKVPLRPKIAMIRGDQPSSAVDANGPFWMKLPFTGRLVMSSYHIGPNTGQQYLDKLSEFKPDVIMAYPSSISLLAQIAKESGWKADWPLRCILTSSETFKRDKQMLAAEVFGNVVCDHYGLAERVAVLQSCSQGHYHVRDDYAWVEFVQDEHGLKIVGTNIHNSAMPMTRYDTADYVQGLNTEGDCLCGNRAPYVEQILGREDDYIILPDGRQIGRMDVAFKGITGLVEAQLEQVAYDHILIRYVAFPDADIDTLKSVLSRNIRERVGNEPKLEFVAMTALPRTSRGKFKSVVRSKALG